MSAIELGKVEERRVRVNVRAVVRGEIIVCRGGCGGAAARGMEK